MANTWCILRCAGKSTLRLADSLARDGFEVWTPIEKIRQRGRRGKDRVPIIATFVFASARHLWTMVELSDDPLSPHEPFSVMRHIGGLGYPTIDDSELEPLRSEENRAAPKEDRWIPARHEPVKLPEGPFAGMSGIVETADHKHAYVRFGGFMRPVKISTFLLRRDVANRFQPATGIAA